MNWTLFLFVFLTIIAFIAWIGKYRTSIAFFILFLIASMAVFLQQVTTSLSLQF